MLIFFTPPEGWEQRASEQQQIMRTHFSAEPDQTLVLKKNDLVKQRTHRWAAIQVKEGQVGLMLDGSRVLALEPGDVWLGHPGNILEWYQDGAIEIEIWYWHLLPADVIAHIIQNYNDLLLELVNSNTRQEPDPIPGFEFFKSGDVIIQEGEPADSVYTLIQGHANVLVGGIQVATVKENEIIGLQAMLLNTTRTASVIADGPCSAVKVTYENFQTLIETRPELVVSTMETMAQQLERANKRLTKQ